MTMIYGVSSNLEANLKLSNGFQTYDWIVRKNRFPQFWGRSIDGSCRIQREEIEFLHGKNCRIALIYNGATEEGACSLYGVEDGVCAVEAAQSLGVPSGEGYAIFAKIQPEWQVWENWIYGFAETVSEAGFVPGFIANTDSSINCSFDRSYNRFLEISREEDHFGCLVWATEPKQEEPEVWMPFCPSDITPDQISLWQASSVECGGQPIEENWLRNEEILQYMW